MHQVTRLQSILSRSPIIYGRTRLRCRLRL